MKLRFAILALVQVFSPYGVVYAQLSPRLERCLPYPTLAQEISAMQEETRAQEPEPVPTPRVVIASIQFAPATHISESVRSQIIRSIKSPQFHDDAKMDWLEELQDVGILGTLQDSGYFNSPAACPGRTVARAVQQGQSVDRRRRLTPSRRSLLFRFASSLLIVEPSFSEQRHAAVSISARKLGIVLVQGFVHSKRSWQGEARSSWILVASSQGPVHVSLRN